MPTAYKRLLNELNKLNYKQSIIYNLYIINSGNIMFRCDINFKYNDKIYIIKVYYNELYPFIGPVKIELNNINLFKIYKDIISINSSIFNNNCLWYKSLLCTSNWNISKNIIDILNEIKKVIYYKQLYIKRLLLNRIINKYTSQNMEYLEKYLV